MAGCSLRRPTAEASRSVAEGRSTGAMVGAVVARRPASAAPHPASASTVKAMSPLRIFVLFVCPALD